MATASSPSSRSRYSRGTPPRDITLRDGTVVAVTPGQPPLPQPVIDQIVADAAPGAAQVQIDDEFAPMAGRRSIHEVASAYADQIGRTVVIVYRDFGTWGGTISSVEESGGTALGGTSDQDAMVAAATDWAESHDAYVVVVE